MARGLNIGLAVLGGAMHGIGQGIMFQANSVRQQALEQNRLDAETQRDKNRIDAEATQRNLDRTQRGQDSAADRSSRSADNAAQLSAADARNKDTIKSEEHRSAEEQKTRRGLIVKTFIGDDGLVSGLDASGNEVKTKLKGDLTAAEKAELKLAEDTATTQTVDPETNHVIKNMDIDKLRARLANSNSPTIRAMAKSYTPTDTSMALSVEAGAPPTATVTPDGNSTRGLVSTGVGDLQKPLDDGEKAAVTEPPAAATAADPDKKAQAEKIRKDYKDGKIKKEEANRLLEALGI